MAESLAKQDVRISVRDMAEKRNIILFAYEGLE